MTKAAHRPDRRFKPGSYLPLPLAAHRPPRTRQQL